MAPKGDNWNEYRRHVVSSLDSTSERLDQIDDRLRSIEQSVSVIQSKIYVAAATSAIVFTAIATVIVDLVKSS